MWGVVFEFEAFTNFVKFLKNVKATFCDLQLNFCSKIELTTFVTSAL